MRRIIHLIFSPASRLARLMVGEKRLSCDYVLADDASAHLPVYVEQDETRLEGLWAIVDHLEGEHPEHPLFPEEEMARRETLRWLDILMGIFPDRITKRIVFEKANPRYTGVPSRSTPDMNVIRKGREELHSSMAAFGQIVDNNGYLACRTCTIADLALAANLSALDYFGEVKWNDYPQMKEWYMRVKSRPAMRNLLSDRVPGQPPVMHYEELDF